MKKIDKFEVLAELGSGGMSRVYKGYDRDLKRHVAIKELRAELKESSETQERFDREAQALANLSHPNLVTVYHFLKKTTARYFVMEYVEGITIEKLLEKAGPIPVLHAVIIAHGVAEALAYAHSAKIVHRDIKPSNIMVSKRGEVKLMDFGISRALYGTENLTSPGIFIGTPAYCSPEQLEGGAVDNRTDIFSFGIVFYEMLTGEVPFKGNLLEKGKTRWKFVRPRKKNRKIPRFLSRVVSRSLRYSPWRRYRSIEEPLRILKKYLKKNLRNKDSREILVEFLCSLNLVENEETVLIGDKRSKKEKVPYGWMEYAIKSLFIVLFSSAIFILYHYFSNSEIVAGPRGYLMISVSPWADVRIGRNFEERVDSNGKQLSMPVGEHYIYVVNPFCRDEKLKIFIKKGRLTKKEVNLKECNR